MGREPALDPRRERRAERIGAAAYGTVLVLTALALVEVTDVGTGHGVELVAGVGVATWIAHLFAELLAEHVRHDRPLTWAQVTAAAADGSPIFIVTVLPALALLLGSVDLVSDETARTLAILLALAQLSLIGAVVGRLSPTTTSSAWGFAAVVAAAGIVVVGLEVALGH
jgi:hypothetical protein